MAICGYYLYSKIIENPYDAQLFYIGPLGTCANFVPSMGSMPPSLTARCAWAKMELKWSELANMGENSATEIWFYDVLCNTEYFFSYKMLQEKKGYLRAKYVHMRSHEYPWLEICLVNWDCQPLIHPFRPLNGNMRMFKASYFLKATKKEINIWIM